MEDGGFFSDLQFGFRADRSVVDCHLLLREIILNRKFCIGPKGGRNQKKPVFSAFLDIKKAFDKVPRNLLWKKLFDAGVRGRFLRVVMDQFTGNRGVVRIDDMETREFPIDSGVLQGSILGPALFLIFINDLLLELHESGFGGVNVGENLRVNSLGYADDLALFAESPAGLQKLLKICENWSKENGLEFAPTKSKIIIFHPSKCSKKQRKFEFSLNGVSLEKVPHFEYLGITLESKGSVTGPGRAYQKHFVAQMDKAERRLGAVRLLGFHKDGLRLKTAIKLYKLLVRPLLEFAAQVLPYNKFQLDEMEKFQCKALRTLFGLFPSVKAETVRLLAGVEPIACRFAVLRANYFHRLRTSQKATIKLLLSHAVSDRKLARCFSKEFDFKATAEWVRISKHSFAGLIEATFSRFGLSNEFHFLDEQTRPDFSKKVNSFCKQYFFKKDVSTFANTQQGKLFKEVVLPWVVATKPYSGCAINPVVFKHSSREHRTTFLQCLSGAHFATEFFCSAFKKERSKKCPFCPSNTRTLDHYILDCSFFKSQRLALLNSISHPANLPLDPKFLFGRKHLGSSELTASQCGGIKASSPGASLLHMANFLHSLRLVFEKYGKS